MRITAEKTRTGWVATTVVRICAKRVLVITTEKAGAMLASTAQAAEPLAGDLVRFDPLSDFRKRVLATTSRCTENNVLKQHALALERAAQLRAEVESFYGLKKGSK